MQYEADYITLSVLEAFSNSLGFLGRLIQGIQNGKIFGINDD